MIGCKYAFVGESDNVGEYMTNTNTIFKDKDKDMMIRM